jgi:hypothetical protein
MRRISAPLRVAVHGRDGVGRGTVSAALTASGVAVVSDATADVRVVVIAETLKPEDLAMLGAFDGPILTVLNKADLGGLTNGGPLALAHRRAADFRALTGVPTVPMVALLAIAELDDELIGALRTLVTEPADLTSADGFVHSEHSLSHAVRRRLLETIDRFGVAHAVLALGEGAHAAATGSSSTSMPSAHRPAIDGSGRRSPNCESPQYNPAIRGSRNSYRPMRRCSR